MPKKTKLDKLPRPIYDIINKLRQEEGRTVDEIMAKLQELNVDIARSTLARGLAKIDEFGAILRERKETAKALAADGTGDEDLARANEQLLQSALMNLTLGQELSAKEALAVSASLKNSADARRMDSERRRKDRKEAKEEAASTIRTEGKRLGVSAES